LNSERIAVRLLVGKTCSPIASVTRLSSFPTLLTHPNRLPEIDLLIRGVKSSILDFIVGTCKSILSAWTTKCLLLHDKP
jgi:hypothetical protein